MGADFTTDLAVIKAEDGADGRPLLPPGDSDGVRVGQPVVALGAPLGLSNTVTAGIVSALGRYVPIPADTGRVAHLLDAIQTDAAINPGNSGGPLVDCDGAQVGVNSAISTVPNSEGVGGGGSVGLGFAIPMSIAIPIADQLIESGQVDHPVLGLAARTVAEEPDRSAGDRGRARRSRCRGRPPGGRRDHRDRRAGGRQHRAAGAGQPASRGG